MSFCLNNRYSIQGWLTSINNSQLTKDGISNDDENDLFGMQLYYADVDAALGNTARYNGQISAVTWQTHNPSSTSIGNTERERSYTYHYNKGNRLIAAHYKAKDKGTTQWNQELKGYNTSYSYDLNGNLQSLQRNAMDINGTIVQMDDLLYTYTGNRVRQVTDKGDQTLGFEEIAGITAPYDYDANGNITTQTNRGINTIEYNYLDKVTKVEKVKNGQTITIEYVYTAEGNKIQKLETIAGKTTQTDYVANQVFKDHMLEYIQFDEGRIRTTSSYTTFLLADEIQYEYYLKDHLGNVRMVVEKDEATGELIVSQENHYSPYGLKLEGYINNTSIASNPNPYGFGGSEIESALNTWHLHYRMYDPAIGMFWQVDPAKHMLNMTSPYMYVHGDPANFTDPLGACEIPLRCDDNVGPTLENGNFFSLDQYTAEDVEESKTRVIEGTMSLEIKVHYEMSQEKEIVEEPRQLTKEEKQEIVDDWKSQNQNLSPWMDYPVGEPEDLSIDEGFDLEIAFLGMVTSFNNLFSKVGAKYRDDDTYWIQEVKKRRTLYGNYVAVVVGKEMTFGTTESLIQGVADGVGVIPSSSGAGAYAKTGASKTLAKKAVQEVAEGGEQILSGYKTYEQARNKALELIGYLGHGSKPVTGRLKSSAGYGKTIGRQSADGKVRWRLDYDPNKGTHINVEDFRMGKGGDAKKYAIPFEGNESTYKSLLKHLQ